MSQARDEREIEFRVDSTGRYVDSARQHARSRSGYVGGNYSDHNGGDHDQDGLHDPDMQWTKFGSKNNSMTKNHNKSSQLNEMNGNSTMRHMAMNDKIDGVHDRRNKYLGANSNSNQDDSTSMERSKPYAKHLVPLSPSNGSSGRGGVSNGT